jgi:hypothetical protein
MATYLRGLWTPNLLDMTYMPIGVVVRDGEDVAVRLVGESRLPDGYKPVGELSKAVWKDMAEIFRSQKEYSTNPTNLYFTKHNLEFEGSLEEKAEKFFERFVAPSLK